MFLQFFIRVLARVCKLMCSLFFSCIPPQDWQCPLNLNLCNIHVVFHHLIDLHKELSSKLLTFNAGCHRRHIYNISRFLFKHLQKNTYVIQMQTMLSAAGPAE